MSRLAEAVYHDFSGQQLRFSLILMVEAAIVEDCTNGIGLTDITPKEKMKKKNENLHKMDGDRGDMVDTDLVVDKETSTTTSGAPKRGRKTQKRATDEEESKTNQGTKTYFKPYITQLFFVLLVCVYLLCYQYGAVGGVHYDQEHKRTNFAINVIAKACIGKSNSSKNLQDVFPSKDKNGNPVSPQEMDYKWSTDYTKGHIIPKGDYSRISWIQEMTMFSINICPEVKGLHAKANLEVWCRALVTKGQCKYIVRITFLNYGTNPRKMGKNNEHDVPESFIVILKLVEKSDANAWLFFEFPNITTGEKKSHFQDFLCSYDDVKKFLHSENNMSQLIKMNEYFLRNGFLPSEVNSSQCFEFEVVQVPLSGKNTLKKNLKKMLTDPSRKKGIGLILVPDSPALPGKFLLT